MAYNNYFPANYQPYQQQFQGYQQPNYQQYQQPQMMTPPTIHAEIVQVDNEEAATKYPVGVGGTQMMMSKDESAFFVKTVGANGQYDLAVFEKRPPAPSEPPFDLQAYVRKDELNALISAILSENKPIPRKAKKEEMEDEK